MVFITDVNSISNHLFIFFVLLKYEISLNLISVGHYIRIIRRKNTRDLIVYGVENINNNYFN